MAFGTGFSNVDFKEFATNVDSENLLRTYLGIEIIPCVVNAPYRKDDNPSLSIYYNKSGKVKFKDFATGESGSIIDLLSKIWNKDFQDTIRTILKDNSKGSTLQSSTKRKIKSKHVSSFSELKVSIREWRDYDLEYWNTYGVSKDWLKFGDVYPVSRIFFTNSIGETKIFPAEKYAYCYVERKDNKVTLKIYQPFSKTNKWMNNHNSSIWDLWTKLPEYGDNLIITSSRKDALCLWENTGIPTVSLQGEGYIPKEHVVNQLKHRFKNIYVLYDNDFTKSENHGRIDGQKICEKFGLTQIELPESLGCKDPSDLVKEHGRYCLQETIKQLLNETKHTSKI